MDHRTNADILYGHNKKSLSKILRDFLFFYVNKLFFCSHKIMPAFYKIAGAIHTLILRMLRCVNSFSFKILMRAGALNF